MKMKGKVMTIPAGICLGIGFSLLCAVLGAAVLCWLVASERVGEASIGYGVMVILMVSAAAGCLLTWGKIRHRRLLVTGLCALGYYLALLAAGMLFGGVREGLAPGAAMIGLGGGISLIPGLLGSGSGARRPKLTHFR